MTPFEQYIEQLATLHPAIGHSDEECHFSFTADDSQSRMASRMHYPCVVVDTGDFAFGGQPGNVFLSDEVTLFFLQHVRDTGDIQEVRQAFADMRGVLLDFVRRFSRDKRALRHKFLARFTVEGAEGHRVYMQDAGLYGWALLFSSDASFTDLDCNHIFPDEP